MLKIISFLFLVMCLGCVVETETGPVVSSAPSDDDEGMPYYDRDPGPAICGQADHHSVTLPDGTVFVVEVPIPCEEFYVDKGDPHDKINTEETRVNPVDVLHKANQEYE